MVVSTMSRQRSWDIFRFGEREEEELRGLNGTENKFNKYYKVLEVSPRRPLRRGWLFEGVRNEPCWSLAIAGDLIPPLVLNSAVNVGVPPCNPSTQETGT